MTLRCSKRLPNLYRALFLFLSISTAYGCKTTVTSVSPSCEVFEDKGIELLIKDILKSQGLDSFTAKAEIEINKGSERHVFRLAIILKKPSYLRVEVIPILGPIPLLLTIRDGALKFFLPQKMEFYIGKATSANLSTLLFPIKEIDIDNLISIMAGSFNFSGIEKVLYKRCENGNYLSVDILNKNGTVENLLLELLNRRIVQAVLFKDKRIVYRLTFKDFAQISKNQIMPLKVSIIQNDNTRVTLRYSDLEYINTMDATLFDLSAPESVQPIYLR